MEHDIRRERGQWRGCHSFKDIICDGDNGGSPRRDGGLKMGQTYYFYYELDGSTETHDPSLPSTNTCPYLPGQTVNTLWVPMEDTTRQRCASLNSMSEEDWRTMNPDDKFISPRPAPSPPININRPGTAPIALRHKRSARSLSPHASWTFSPRKLFSRKASSSSLKDAERRESRPTTPAEDRHNSVSSEISHRSRDLSPGSLHRFLSDDEPIFIEAIDTTERPALAIPEDIAEEIEDDDNFATSAINESMAFTVLSPPPTRSSTSACPSPAQLSRTPSLTLDTLAAIAPQPPTRTAPKAPISYVDTSFLIPASPMSPQSPFSNEDLPSFYDSEDDDDEALVDSTSSRSSGVGLGDTDSFSRNLNAALSAYSLPSKTSGDKSPQQVAGSPPLMARNGSEVLAQIPSSGLDELVSELGWIGSVIHREP